MTTKASAAVDLSVAATWGTRRGSSWRRAPIDRTAVVPVAVRIVSRAAERASGFTDKPVVQCPGRQRWICSTAWRKTTLSPGAVLLLVDNRVDLGNASV